MNEYCGYTYLDKNQDVDRDSPFIHQKIVELRCQYLYGLCMRKLHFLENELAFSGMQYFPSRSCFYV